MALSAISVTIDNYTAAYVAPTGNSREFIVVPKNPPPGVTTTVTATISATNALGTALPPVPVLLDIPGPPLSATKVVINNLSFAAGAPFADPGSATITVKV